MTITMNEYKAIRAEVEAGSKISPEVAEQVNAFAKARKVKRIPESAIMAATETVVKEKKTVGRPKGETKFCSHEDHKAKGAKQAPVRANGLCVAHSAKAKYASDPAVREARKAASSRYAAKIRALKAEQAKIDAAAQAESASA